MNRVKEVVKENGFDIIKIIISLVLLIVARFVTNEFVSLVLYILSLIIVGYELLFDYIKSVIHLEFLDENVLMLIGSIVSFILGNYFEGVMILLLFSIGELFEGIATDSSKNKINSLKEIKIEKCFVLLDESLIERRPQDVEIGSIIQVRKGERIPIDGILLSKQAELDLKSITGESKHYILENGNEVYSGSINLGEALEIKTTKQYADSMMERIISLVENSENDKSKSQTFINKFAKIYTPIVVFVSLIVAVIPPLFDNFLWTKWIYKSLSFIVVACPCALVISVPLAFFVGIGLLAKSGVLVKGSIYIENMSKIKTVVFDKTGTLTKGNLIVDDIDIIKDHNKKEVLSIIYALEKDSNHNIAKCLTNYLDKFDIDKNLKIENKKEQTGLGITCEYNNKSYAIGNITLLKKFGIVATIGENYSVFLVENNQILARISFIDEIKEDSVNISKQLSKNYDIESTILSGDSFETVKNVANSCNINNYYFGLLPEEKLNKLEELKRVNKTMFVGDGINDAPSIKNADVGVAMGGLGSDIAIDSADVVILDDKIKKVPYIIRKSKQIMKRVYTNIVVSIFVKILVMALSFSFTLPVWVAIFADVGILILAIINSITISKK